MKITKLIIKKLYKHYNYEIIFNEDITIIYGLNGSGKTTVLNILSYLISGDLYNIFEYDFEEIKLYYMNDKYEKKYIAVFNDNNKINRKLILDDNDKKYELIRQITPVSGIYQEFSCESFRESYPVLEDIRRRFRKVYLPLNRGFKYQEKTTIKHLLTKQVDEHSFYNYSIKKVEDIIKREYSEVEYKTSLLNDKFRNNTLKSFSLQFTQDNSTNVYSLISSREKIEKRIDTLKNRYIKILQEIGLIKDDEKEQYNNYFNDVLLALNKLENDIRFNDIDDYLKLYLKIEFIYRLEEIVRLADNLEEQKKRVKKTLTLFIYTINDFFRIGSDDNKSLIVKGNRQVYIQNKYGDHISFEKLSSGEKQILILFTYLMFELRNGEAVFIVDEPEMSLHLLWQRLYLDKIREVAPNVQIIFATHSPEIVSHYKNKMFKLSKDKVDEKIDE